jgi:hypothetical protein
MSAVAAQDRPMVDFSAPRLFEPSGSSLEDVVLGAWNELVATGRAACLVCGGDLHPVGCIDCGSQLS